jgi:rubredoxin
VYSSSHLEALDSGVVTSMASWALTCKHCGWVFIHSNIGETLADYFVPSKPFFPPQGIESECPNCKVKRIYLKNELTYVPETNR